MVASAFVTAIVSDDGSGTGRLKDEMPMALEVKRIGFIRDGL